MEFTSTYRSAVKILKWLKKNKIDTFIYVCFQAHFKTQANFWGVILDFTCPLPQAVALTYICPRCLCLVFTWVNGESPITFRWIWIAPPQRPLHVPVRFHLNMDTRERGHSLGSSKRVTDSQECLCCDGFRNLLQSQTFTWCRLAQFWHKLQIKKLEDTERRREKINLWVEVLLNLPSYLNHRDGGVISFIL